MRLPQVEGSAPADSALGLLQRGRGDGWTRAAAIGSKADLLECLAAEPRWDRQVESRSDYYATLALNLRLTVADISSITLDEDNEWILCDVVAAMSERGADDVSTFRLDAGCDEDVSIVSAPKKSPSTSRATPLAGAPVAELLGTDWRGPFPKAVVHRLRTTTDPRELDALRKASADPGTPGWRFALRVLALRGDATPLALVEQILNHDEPGSIRAAAFQYVRDLPAEASLPLARAWLAHADGRGSVAATVLGIHGEPGDVEGVRTALEAAGDYYTISSLIEALGRCAEAGPFPELEQVYVGSAYSYARARAVEAMAATNPGFSETRAIECLWDCEPAIRLQGAIKAPLEPPVVARLHELAHDPHESAEVREAATTRGQVPNATQAATRSSSTAVRGPA